MRIKKFYAASYNEALQCVKRELGEDAMVLNTRSIKYDRDGARQAGMVEITAAMDPDVREPVAARSTFERSPRVRTFFEERDEAAELRVLARSLIPLTERARAMGLEADQVELFRKLVDGGVDERLVSLAFQKVNRDKITGGAQVRIERLKSLMKKALNCAGPVCLKRGAGPRVVALVGPTGVGKTTTLAKLAARFALGGGHRVALVSLDTYRMGALEQLEAYGQLMKLPVEQAAGRLELAAIMRKHADRDLVLIDTMGRNPGDRAYVEELRTAFKAAGEVEVHLVQSVTQREEVVNHSVRQFAPLGLDRLLFTKLDEGLSFGMLFNAAVRHRLPFSYLTCGQRVPEDIEVAGRDKVIRLIFN